MWHKPGRLLNSELETWIKTPTDGAGIKIELIPHEYRYVKKLAAGSTLDATLGFFTTGIGGTDAGVIMDETRCNLKQPRQLEHPYKFLITGICCDCFADKDETLRAKESAATLRTLFDNIEMVMRSGLLRVRTLDKEYVNVADLYRVPAGAGPMGALALSQAGEVAASHDSAFIHSNGMPVGSNVWPCEIPLGSKQSFDVTVEFPGYKPVLDAAYDLNLGVYLRGILQRNG
jgi:hypothetical protein